MRAFFLSALRDFCATLYPQPRVAHRLFRITYEPLAVELVLVMSRDYRLVLLEVTIVFLIIAAIVLTSFR